MNTTININPLVATLDQPQFTGYLTPDALMAYCQTRLQGIDSQVQTSFVAQQQANADSTVLSDLSNVLSIPSQNIDLSSAGGVETAKNSADAMMAAAQKLGDTKAKQDLMNAAKAIYARIDKVLAQATSGGKWKSAVGNNLQPPEDAPSSAQLSDGQIEDLFKNFQDGSIDSSSSTIDVADFTTMTTTAVQNIQKDLNSSTELSMINLQSLMSQRQEAIQLCTNLVQSLGDQVNKIADNVGH
jgi:hypothetical protein